MEWTASIAYTESNTIRMTKVIQNTFHFGQKFLLMVMSAIVAVSGVKIGLSSAEGLLLLALGCILFMNTDMGARARARHTLAQLRGYIPKMTYTFSQNGFRGVTDREDHTFSYQSIIRLVDDGKFLYLFQTRELAFMVDKSTIQPAGTAALKEHLSKQAGLAWTTSGNWLNSGLLTLIGNWKNTRKQP